MANELKEQTKADVLIGNNVLAHVPNLNDFVQGMKILLKSDGVISIEFPHLLQLIEQNQFDTIYHEHLDFHTVFPLQKLFDRVKIAPSYRKYNIFSLRRTHFFNQWPIV